MTAQVLFFNDFTLMLLSNLHLMSFSPNKTKNLTKTMFRKPKVTID